MATTEMKVILKTAFWMAVSGFATSVAQGQSMRTVSPVQVKMGGWRYVSTLIDGHVETILALRIDAPVGDNLTAVWYRSRAEGGWDSWSWTTASQAKIISSVKATLGIAVQDDALWPVQCDVETAGTPQSLVSGVFESDPFAPILSLADPSTAAVMLAALEDAGWQAASNAPALEVCGGAVLDVQLLASCVDVNTNDEDSAAGELYAVAIATNCAPTQGSSGTCLRTVTEGGWGVARYNVTWTAGASTLQGPIDGPCQIVNHYTAIGMATQCQRLTVTCSDCSIIKRTQCKTWWIRWTHAQNETNPRRVTPCAIPPGYAPPAAPTAAPVPPANFEGPFDETDPVPSASSICP